MKRIADSLREKAKIVALKAEAKREREKKKEENRNKQQELKDKRAQNKEKRAQEKVRKAQEKETKEKENEANGKVKKQRVKKNKTPKNMDECLSLNKCCLKCGLAFGDEIESSRHAWRNCEFKLRCPNWYCLKCVPAQSSSSEIVCSECQSVN